MELYYAIASCETNGKRIFQNGIWAPEDFVIEFYENFKKKFPEKNPQLYKDWEIKAKGEELLRLWNKADDLAEKVQFGRLSIEELSDLLE